MMGFALPLFFGRGIFNKLLGILPFRRPIHVVVGAPIAVPVFADVTVPEGQDGAGSKRRKRISELGEKWLFKDEGAELVDKIHAQYMDAVRKLYQEHKGRFFIERAHSMIIE
mmetsp:Transcript_1566/g.4265  ORF Transcript_1566/g.4265 Transcript_1566/m.4265 type:complete len:112 (+) Transcript_1566:922-1257(+)